MQPELSGRSQLFDSLKTYLNNKSRLQPIIGLSSITECVNVGSADRETSYVCEVCVCRLTKADIRNHILGSHHRFNYIKTRHPHLSSKWQELDLSKLAWPLMELAKMLEGKEGPGDVQLIEVPDAVYQKIATESEDNAAALINALRDEQSPSRSFSDATSLHYPFESERIVLRAHNRRGASEVSDSADVKPYEIFPQTEFPPLIPARQTPESKVRLKSTSTLENTPAFPEPSVLSENNNFFGDFSGGTSLVGLVCVAELRSENGSSYGFLCHCCRIKSNKNDIFDHLTSYSHLSNYMIENQPGLVSILNEDTEANFQLLQSLADRVEQQEGRGEPTIINVPESFCRQITGKSYHWCLSMLSNGWVNTNVQKKREAIKGVTKPMKNTVVMSNQAKGEKPQKKKKKKKTNTKFNVSLPFHKGAMLLKRTSFNQDNLFELTSPVSDLEQILSPGDRELKSDSAVFENANAEVSSNLQTSQLEQDLCEGDVDFDEFIPGTGIRVTVFQDADGVHFTQSAKETETKEEHTGRTYGRHHGAQSLFRDWQNEGVQAKGEGLFPAVSHDEAQCPYNSYYRREEGGSDGWHSSASVQTRVDGSRQSDDNTTPPAVQHYHHQNQQRVWNDSGSGSMWAHRDLPGDVASIIEAARTNVETQSVHSRSVSSQHGVRSHESEPRQTPSGLSFNGYYMHPQSYVAQSAAGQAGYVDLRVNSQNTGPSTNPGSYGTYPASSGDVWGAWMQPNAFIQPGQAVYYGASSDVYFRTWGPN
ncbi:uncharacterized protein si:ch211-199g17.2 [Nematolebias whitei]|uniref:uncharacterized protein si:ch211-199g17.2 n=1 Tax=Nematolebias whitei TaxID=451745 RepID=UPI00189A93E0|nr:uncharacterized protein si:ch211-199g17.2 [Nematolebias whitei]